MTLTHQQVVNAIEGADKTTLIHAMRAIFTNHQWKQDERTLRNALHAYLHTDDATNEEVWASLGLELPNE